MFPFFECSGLLTVTLSKREKRDRVIRPKPDDDLKIIYANLVNFEVYLKVHVS